MITTVDLVLTGARAGKTIKLNGKQFVKGVLRLRGSHEQLEPVLSYYGRVYAAHPHGSEALKNAQARDAAHAAKVNGNGQHNAQSSAQSRPTDGVSGSGANDPAGSDKAPAPATQHGGSDGSQAGSEGLRPGGDGHGDPRLRSGQVAQQQQPNAVGDLTKIREAVLSLDPNVDENWTPEGKPAVEAVAQAANDASVSRKQIDAAAGDWNREQAAVKKRLA